MFEREESATEFLLSSHLLLKPKVMEAACRLIKPGPCHLNPLPTALIKSQVAKLKIIKTSKDKVADGNSFRKASAKKNY